MRDGGARTYYTIIKACYLWSNWIDTNTDLYFSPTKTALSGITLDKIVEVLIERQKWHLSMNFIRIQAEFEEDDAKLSLYSKYLQRCEAQGLNNDDNLSLALLNGRLFLAETMLVELEMVDEAKQPLSDASKQLEGMPWIRASDQQKRLLQKLQIDDYPLLSTHPIPELLALATAVHVSGDRLMETQILSRIGGRMNQVDSLYRDETWHATNNEWIRRYTDIHSDSNSNVILIAISVSRLANMLGSSEDQAELSRYLYKLAKFEAAYPDFEIPTVQRDLYRGAAVVLKALGRREEAEIFEAKKMEAILNSPSDPSQFFRKYRDKPFDDWAPYLMELILRWIESEMKAGKLSVMQAAQMLLSPTERLQAPEEVAEIDLGLTQPPSVLVERLYGSAIPVKCEIWEQRLGCFESWLWHSPTNVKRYIRHTVLGDLQQARCASVTKYMLRVINDTVNPLFEDLQLDAFLMKKHENDRLLNLRKKLDPNAMGASEDAILSQEWSCVLDQAQLASSFKAFRTGATKDHDLLEAQKFFQVFLSSNTNNLVRRLVTINQIASIKGQRYKLFGTLAADAPLDNFVEYDKVYMEQRMAKSILRGADNLVARTELVSRYSFTNHYDFAIGYCVEAMNVAQLRNNYHRHIHQDMTFLPPRPPPPSRDLATLFTELIDWTQRKKARSVTEALGAEIIIPRAVLANTNHDEHAQKLLRQEAELQQNIDNNEGDVVELSRAINTIRSEMRSCSSLIDIMNLRDGQALNRAQIKSLAQTLGKNVLIVDYVYIPSAFTGLRYQIIPMVYKGGDLVSAHIITQDLDFESINRWTSTYLDKEWPLLTDEPALKYLYPLVDAAVQFSSPGDSIVLCPTNILFRVPLHAIELPDGQPFIQRNPIIYTQSLSILRLCQTSATGLNPACDPKVLAVQALSDKDLALPEAADMAFTSRIKARLLQRQALNKQSFLQACTEAELVHFYGHVSYDQPKALDQYLAIRDLESERVTVRDLFELRLRTGAHVNLIGCQSGRSQVGINDDLLGLSTALMFAGATSVVAALWSIQMDDAAAFQEAFFDELIMQSSTSYRQREAVNDEGSGDGPQKCVDMAIAVQKAVLKIMKDETGEMRAPYHWAGFFLQGCWNKFPILKGLDEHEDRRP